MDYVTDNEEYKHVLKKSSEATNIYYSDDFDPEIDEKTLKIDTEMAVAMTTGYVKNETKLKTCIMSSHKNSVALRDVCYDPKRDLSRDLSFVVHSDTPLNRKIKCFEIFPKFITHNKIYHTWYNVIHNPKIPVSGIRNRPLSYFGTKVKNEILVDCIRTGRSSFKFRYIASLVAKYHIKNTKEMWREICKSGIFDIWELEAPYNNIEGKEDPMILLLRVYELEDFEEDFSISVHHDLYDEVKGNNIRCVKKEPTIKDDEFLNIHENLDSILIDHESIKFKELYTHKFIEKNNNQVECTEIICVKNFKKL